MKPLKRLRLEAGKTQSEVAKAVGTSQPNYQRWENGATVPNGKQKRLALILDTKVSVISGEIQLYEIGTKDNEYYGEIAIHFNGSGDALMFPISVREMTKAINLRWSENADEFIMLESLDNRIFGIRSAAIEDIYLSSDACDLYGPEHKTYKGHIGVYNIEDYEYWEALTYFDVDGEISDGFDEDSGITEQLLKQIKEVAGEDIKLLKKYADHVMWQFSSGKCRDEQINEPKILLDVIHDIEFDNDLIKIDIDGYHRVILITKNNLDYISIPRSLYQNACLEDIESDIDK